MPQLDRVLMRLEIGAAVKPVLREMGTSYHGLVERHCLHRLQAYFGPWHWRAISASLNLSIVVFLIKKIYFLAWNGEDAKK